MTFALTVDDDFRYAKSDTVVFTMPPDSVTSVRERWESAGIVARWDADRCHLLRRAVQHRRGATWATDGTNQSETSYMLKAADDVLPYVIEVREVNGAGGGD